MYSNYLRVLGSADWHQTAFNDHSCYTINDKILIDACPSVVTHLQEHGADPIDIPVICFTHMHCDHIMGLPPILHYWYVCKNKNLGELTIIGPKATIHKKVKQALSFMFGSDEEIQASIREMPQIIEMEGNMAMDLPGFRVMTINSHHAVPGICYRIQDLNSGKTVGFTGDTAYIPEFGMFFKETDLLLHEVSYGAGPVKPGNPGGHSSAEEAVRVCREADVKRLLLTHTYEPNRDGALAAVRRNLSIPVEWAVPHQVYPF